MTDDDTPFPRIERDEHGEPKSGGGRLLRNCLFFTLMLLVALPMALFDALRKRTNSIIRYLRYGNTPPDDA